MANHLPLPVARLPSWPLLLPLLPPVLLLGLWWLASSHALVELPDPLTVVREGWPLLKSPFTIAGPSEVGLGWLVLYSLGRVALGFGLALLVAVPMGLAIGSSGTAMQMCDPTIQGIKSVSPLAWLPVGLAALHHSEMAAIFVIFITSLCPLVLNTALGVRSIPKGYWKLARVLDLPRRTVLGQIVVPVVLPYVFTGVRISLGIAWMVIVAAEMLTGGEGIGAFVWNAWNNLNLSALMLSIGVIGLTGVAIDRLTLGLAHRCCGSSALSGEVH